MKWRDAFKRDNMLIDLLRKRTGVENIISGAELAKLITEGGYPTPQNNIKRLINHLIRERHLPICSLSGKGYFWPTRETEIQASINNLQSMSNELQERIKILQSYIMEKAK